MILFKNKKDAVFALLYGFLFCFINFFIYKGSDWMNLNTGIFIQIIILSLLMSLFVGEIYLRIKALLRNKDLFVDNDVNKASGYYVKTFLVHFLSYFVVFLAYYPGIFAYDVHHQLAVYSTKHPLLHTLFIRFFYYVIGGQVFKNYNIGIAFATVTQIIIFSLMISLLHYVIYRVNIKKVYRYIMIGFSCLCPIFSVLVISHTKDIFFTGFFIVFISCVFAEEFNVNLKNYNLLFMISVVGLCLFRNNCMYAFVLVLFYFLIKKILLKKEINRKMIISIIASIAISFVISTGLKIVLQAQDVSKNQFLSIPYQQIANVYHKEYNSLDKETKEFCEFIMQDIDLYNIHIADDLKSTGRALADPVKFVTTYIKLGMKYPLDYINAFLQTNSGFLYVLDTSTASLYTDDPSLRMGYLATFYWKDFGVETQSKIPFIFDAYEYLFTYNNYQKAYLIRPIFEYAIYIWLIILIVFYYIQDRDDTFELANVFIILYMISVFMGPCALVRYAFPFIAVVPLFIVSYVVKSN